jgi:hypothetical protein
MLRCGVGSLNPEVPKDPCVFIVNIRCSKERESARKVRVYCYGVGNVGSDCTKRVASKRRSATFTSLAYFQHSFR